jgi:competence protein ComEA
MATQGERRALLFLAAVAVLGAGARACRARPAPVDVTAVASQLAAVDSAQSHGRSAARRPRRETPPAREPRPVVPIDLDIATAREIEALPGIGPSLAQRIVADRNANGAFGCLAALDRVKGVGPAMLGRLDTLVTFSSAGVTPCASPARPPEGLPRR